LQVQWQRVRDARTSKSQWQARREAIKKEEAGLQPQVKALEGG